MSTLKTSKRGAVSLVMAALLTSVTTDRLAVAQSTGGGGVAGHYLRTGPAGFGPDTRIRERQSGLRIGSPEFIFGHFVFSVASEYAYTRYEFENLPTRPRDLHHLHVPLRWRAHDDRWLAEVKPVVATSSNVFKDFLNRGSGDDVDLHLRFQFQQWRGPRIGWRAALVRDTAFGSPRVYPAGALLWRGDRVQAEIGLPSSRVDWQARDHLALGAALFPAGSSWHVVSDERAGAAFDFRARAWRGALTANWQPSRRLGVSAQAGVEFHRRYEFEDDTGAAIDRDAGSARYWRLELRFGFGN